ncbi:MAG: UDP-N-acetylmuramate--L-alanine ligase [Lachnospiraceae bacterium]|nr:UDP-N-acetylmuramate--L-alanine ligase [Lachnospiraceae bacterium]
MTQIDFKHPSAVYFIGIGGISMSGLAEILLQGGFTVAGSDWKASALTERLAADGALIHIGEQRAEHITPESGVVVYTAAVHPDNPEFVRANELGLPMMTRAELLGQIMKNYGEAIAISGTHGKTTTTSMVTEIFVKAQTDPTVSVGAILPSIGGNIRLGGQDTFITEACEYTNSFLSFFPTVAAILNISEDHLDFFKDLEDIRHSFKRFAGLLPENGTLVINGEIEDLPKLTEGLSCRLVTFGIHGENLDYRAELKEAEGENCFTIYRRGESWCTLALRVPGVHNVMNALAAAAVADRCGISVEMIVRGLEEFTGAERRFEHKGKRNGFTIVDDYAHHPDEIKATLTAAKGMNYGKVWCVFQPHTYTRTKALLPEFIQALSLADEVILAKIYAAREADIYGVSSADIVKGLTEMGKKAVYLETFEEIEDYVIHHVIHGELLITMGAGDVVKIGENLLKE